MAEKTYILYATELQQLINIYNYGYNKYKHNYVVFS